MYSHAHANAHACAHMHSCVHAHVCTPDYVSMCMDCVSMHLYMYPCVALLHAMHSMFAQVRANAHTTLSYVCAHTSYTGTHIYLHACTHVLGINLDGSIF